MLQVFLEVILMFLGWYDVTAQHDVVKLSTTNRIQATTAFAAGCAGFEEQIVMINLECVQSKGPGREKWWACVMAHEAEHAKSGRGERLPLMRQEICLLRMGDITDADYIQQLIDSGWPHTSE